MLHKISLLIIGLFISYQVNAQTNTSTTIPKLNIVPASADATAFAKYGETPVSLYTGIPDISIPIYTINLKGIKVPINLSYHASGIKIEELATNVGLGWSLNFGGSVTAKINGIPDNEWNGWPNVTSAYQLPINSLQTTWAPNTSWWTDPTYDLMMKLSEDVYDSQPDLYSANLNGKTFKFFYNQSGNVFTMPYTRVKVLGPTEFTDDNDNKFLFGGAETSSTSYYYYGENPSNSISSLSSSSFTPYKITTPYAEEINYIYETYNYSTVNQASHTRYMPFNTQSGCAGVGAPADSRTESTTYTSASRIKKITATNGVEINFYYTQTRVDLPGASALNSIVIKNSNTGEILATYTLNYDYYIFNANSSDPNDYRLKLVSVQKAGEGPYLLQYNQGYLPNRLSKSQDHWGYYNGTGNSTLLPAMPSLGFNDGANREPSSAALHGILTGINYPTGGATTYQFESNSGLAYVGTNIQMEATAYESIDSTVTVPFYVGETTSNFRIRYKSPYGGEPETGIMCDACDVQILNANQVVRSIFTGESAALGEAINILPAGQYYLRIPHVGLTSNGFISISWWVPGSIVTNKTLGGLRVKSITDIPVKGDPITTHYEYVNGTAALSPKYDFVFNKEGYNAETASNFDCSFHAQSASSLIPIGQSKGGTVAYSEVIVYKNSKNEGYTQHKFYHEGGISGSTEYPFGPIIANDWIDGLPIETTTFQWNNATSNFTPLKKIINQYKIAYGAPGVNENEVVGAKISLYKPGIEPTFPQVGPAPRGPEFKVNYYWLYSSWSYPIGKKEITYNPNDTTQKIIIEEKYYYDNPAHIQMTRQLVNNSRGENYMVKLKYPQDINLLYLYHSTPIVEKRVYIKDGLSTKVVNGELSIYKNQPGALLQDYYSLNLNEPVDSVSVASYNGTSIPSVYTKRLNYAYNNAYNVVDVQANEIKKTGYIWGYNNTLVIADVDNASSNEIFYEGFEENGVSGNAQTGLKHSNGAYTVSWTPPNSKSYQISYWYYDGSWKFKELAYTGTSMALTSGTIYDEIRIYPTDAYMNTYTHYPLVGIASKTDTKSQTTYYEYDDYKRLSLIKNEKKEIIKSYSYNFTNYASPQWTDTNVKTCETAGGVNTGNELMQQVDTNPLSPTYNTFRNRNLGNTGNCSQPTIYAKFFLENETSDEWGLYADFVVRFYADAACTIPQTVVDLNLVYNRKIYNSSYVLLSDTNFSDMMANGTEITIGNMTLEFRDGNFGVTNYLEFKLNTSTGYTIVW